MGGRTRSSPKIAIFGGSRSSDNIYELNLNAIEKSKNGDAGKKS
jgi:hypothetical protein